jgi:hypothetical protein
MSSLKEIKEYVLEASLLYIITGALTAITLARIYVFLGGSVELVVNGITFHHFFIGAFLMAIVGVLSFVIAEYKSTNVVSKKLLPFFFGLGFGLVIDEANLLLIGGQAYTLANYYDAYNIAFEFIVILLLLGGLIIETIWKYKHSD